MSLNVLLLPTKRQALVLSVSIQDLLHLLYAKLNLCSYLVNDEVLQICEMRSDNIF